MDFFTVPTATFRVLFVLVILSHSRRKVLHFNVTASPSAEWTSQQVVEAFAWDTAPKYLLRDRDSIYATFFQWESKSAALPFGSAIHKAVEAITGHSRITVKFCH